MPYIGKSPSFGVRNRFVYVMSTSGTTSVSGADANGATLTFTDGAYVDVYLNGVLLKPTTDYNTSTANTIAGLAALSTNDEVTVVVYDVFSVADMVSATSGGTFSGNVTMNGTLDVAGNVSLDGGSFVFNESGANKDFRVESDGDANMLFVDGGNDRVGVGTGTPSVNLHIVEDATEGTPTYAGATHFAVQASASSGDNCNIAITSGSAGTSRIMFGDKDDEDTGKIEYDNSGNNLKFFSNTSEGLRIDSAGNVFSNPGDSTDTTPFNNSSGSIGPVLHSDNRLDVARNTGMISLNNTNGSASDYVDLRKQGSTIGTITDNGSGVVSYNAFTGCHWTRLSDNSKPTILKGTILETIDEMCDWYEVEFTVPEVKYVDGDALPNGKKVGDVKTKSQDKKYLVPFADVGSKKVGNSFTFTYEDGVEYTGTLKLQNEEKHTKCKVSDTADSKKVYGVFFSWDSVDDGYNDMYVAGLGTYVIRVHKDVTVESGDLLVSNGDGTAKVQDDDIIRSKTVAKVLANVKQETYSDGSYTVPCALYCG